MTPNAAVPACGACGARRLAPRSVFRLARSQPVFAADHDEAQLLGDLGGGEEVRRQVVRRRVDQLGEGGEYGFHHQVGHQVDPFVVQLRHAVDQFEVGGQVVGDALAQGGDGLAHRLRAAVLLAGEEEELAPVGEHRVKEDAHRGFDDAAQLELVLADDALGASREDPSPAAAGRYRAAFRAIDADSNQYLAVMTEDGAVVGTLQITFITGLSRQGSTRAIIEAVRIASHRRGGGLGHRLMRWAIEECRERGCASVQLAADRSRLDAHRFYESLGFVATHMGYKLGLSEGVKFCYHALALDEARQAFRPTRLRGANSLEVWFRGVHSDVGGGNDNHALNDITLRWMLHKAIASGLPMKADCVAASCTRANVEGKVSDNFDPIRNRAREPKADDRFHYTVSARARHVNPPDPCTRETEILETKPWVPA